MQNSHNKKYALHIPLLNVPTFPDMMNFFCFCDWFQKMWVLFKIQEGKSLASKSWGCFPIKFCSKNIQSGFQSHNRQFLKHEQVYQSRQQDGALVTLL